MLWMTCIVSATLTHSLVLNGNKNQVNVFTKKEGKNQGILIYCKTGILIYYQSTISCFLFGRSRTILSCHFMIVLHTPGFSTLFLSTFVQQKNESTPFFNSFFFFSWLFFIKQFLYDIILFFL